jgi:hypothetical protein
MVVVLRWNMYDVHCTLFRWSLLQRRRAISLVVQFEFTSSYCPTTLRLVRQNCLYCSPFHRARSALFAYRQRKELRSRKARVEQPSPMEKAVLLEGKLTVSTIAKAEIILFRHESIRKIDGIVRLASRSNSGEDSCCTVKFVTCSPLKCC